MNCISLLSFIRVSPSNSLSRRTKTTTTTTTSSSGDYVSAAEDATETIARTVSVNELQHQRNKEQFDRLFGKVNRDASHQRLQHSPMKVGSGVSLATILQDNGNKRYQGGAEEEPANGHTLGGSTDPQSAHGSGSSPVQSTLVS